METRHSLIVTTTSEPLLMRNQYLAEDLRRHWVEDFVDKETGVIKTIDRYEIIYNRGSLIDDDTLSKILFFIQSGDISGVRVSNQRRMAFPKQQTFLSAWMVSALINGKKRKFILHACSISEAIIITQDFIELNFEGMFAFVSAKEYPTSIIISGRNYGSNTDNTPLEMLYLIDAKIFTDDNFSYQQPYLVWASDVDDAKIKILNFNNRRLKEQHKIANDKDLDIIILSAKIESCDNVIDMEFSMANNTDQE